MIIKISDWVSRHRGAFREISARSRPRFEPSRRAEHGSPRQSPVSSTAHDAEEWAAFEAAFRAAIAYGRDRSLRPQFEAVRDRLAEVERAVRS
jgi:hypothetical protein